MTTFPRLAALAVVLRDDQVLLVRRRNEPDAGLWGFPGGHVEFGETASDAATRELREETGVIALPIRYLTNVDIILRGEAGEIMYHFLLAAVLCRYVSGNPAADDDVSDAAWRNVEDVLVGRMACSKHVDTVLRMAMTCPPDGPSV